LDEKKSMTTAERTMRWILGIAIAVLVLGALYWGMHMMQG